MRSSLRVALVAAFSSAALAACSQSPTSVSGNLPGTQSLMRQSTASVTSHAAPGVEIYEDGIAYHRACGDVQEPRKARCNSVVRDDLAAMTRDIGGTPSGLQPADLQNAYSLNVTGGKNQLVAIVDAYDNPNLEADLQVYRAQWGLPVCTTANGCFRKTDQTGGTNYPSPDSGWGLEESLDVDMVSANCPNCKILVVEANSNYLNDLGASVTEAKKLKAVAISNSYSGGEFQGQDDKTPYNAKRAVTASSGDAGYGTGYPAASRYVTAVGGTYLTRAQNSRGWNEVVWTGTGSGCSQYSTKPSWQTDTGCANRTIGDVAYDASPGSGPAIYDTYGYRGWLVVGGTSVGSPAIAAIYALAGNAKKIHDASYGYAHLSGFLDITSGHNGTCSPTYLCNAGTGYDGPTGNGTPISTTAF